MLVTALQPQAIYVITFSHSRTLLQIPLSKLRRQSSLSAVGIMGLYFMTEELIVVIIIISIILSQRENQLQKQRAT